MRSIHALRLLSVALLGAGLLIQAGCGSDGPKPDDKYASFDRQGMLQHLGSNVIIPAFSDFATKADSLVIQADAFNQTPTAAGLTSLQQQWRRTAGAYKRCEAYQFGPVYDQMLAASIDFWPARPDNLERVIAGNTAYSDAFIEQQGTSVKGLAALEYLLFSRSGGAATELARLTTSPDAAQRRAYLLALSQNLRTKARLIRDTWQNSYLTTYVQHDGQDINGSINQTMNQLIAHIDYIKNTKIGLPAGKKDGTTHPTQVEAYESNNSLNHLLNDLTGIERLYTGAGRTGVSGPGFDDFLDHLEAQANGQPLAPQVTAKLAECRAKALALGTTDLSAAMTSNPAGVTALYDALKQLLVLVKVDMVSPLGVTLTFNDNDGD